MPLVSVAMASYNHERFLPEAIEAILNQTYRDIELIIVDDASKDSSVEIIRSYQKKDSRIRTIFHEKNKGIAKTFNDGIDAASGKFVAKTGSDDVWVEDKIEKQLEVLKNNENLVVYSACSVIDAESNPVCEPCGKKQSRRKRKKSGKIFRELLGGNFICAGSIIFKKENVRDIRFDEQFRYVNDYKFALDLARKYEYHFIPQPLVKYRVHGNNITLKDNAGWLEDFALFGKELLEKYRDEFTHKARARFLFKIAHDAYFRGDIKTGRKYTSKAIIAYPFRMKYLRSLILSFGRKIRPLDDPEYKSRS